MSKAEDRALEAYPSTSHYWNAEPDRNAQAMEFYKQGYNQAEKDHQQTKELLKMLLEAIDYSFAETDGTYDLTLTYPVIDKVKYIKQILRENKQ